MTLQRSNTTQHKNDLLAGAQVHILLHHLGPHPNEEPLQISPGTVPRFLDSVLTQAA